MVPKCNSAIHLNDLYSNESRKIKGIGDFQDFRRMHRPFGKSKRRVIFILIFFINILINLDHGAIPAGTTKLKNELGLDNVALGIIGSFVFLGLVLGSLSAGIIFQTYSCKWTVNLSLLFSCFFLYFFTISENIIVLSLCRIGCGFFQVTPLT